MTTVKQAEWELKRLGRQSVDQTAEPIEGFITAVKGQDGRLPAPPEGDLYVRDPIAARAKAIRDRVALYREQKLEVPEHLQALYDQLPPENVDTNKEVELVDAVTGEHVAEVELDAGSPQPGGVASGTSTGDYAEESVSDPAEAEAQLSSGEGTLGASAKIKFTQAESPAAAAVAQADAIARAMAKAAGEEPPAPTAVEPAASEEDAIARAAAKAAKEAPAPAPKRRGRPPRTAS